MEDRDLAEAAIPTSARSPRLSRPRAPGRCDLRLTRPRCSSMASNLSADEVALSATHASDFGGLTSTRSRPAMPANRRRTRPCGTPYREQCTLLDLFGWAASPMTTRSSAKYRGRHRLAESRIDRARSRRSTSTSTGPRPFRNEIDLVRLRRAITVGRRQDRRRHRPAVRVGEADLEVLGLPSDRRDHPQGARARDSTRQTGSRSSSR